MCLHNQAESLLILMLLTNCHSVTEHSVAAQFWVNMEVWQCRWTQETTSNLCPTTLEISSLNASFMYTQTILIQLHRLLIGISSYTMDDKINIFFSYLSIFYTYSIYLNMMTGYFGFSYFTLHYICIEFKRKQGQQQMELWSWGGGGGDRLQYKDTVVACEVFL